MTELEPCVVCGKPADSYSVTYYEDKAIDLKVECDYCGSKFEIRSYSDPRDVDAVTKWNNLARRQNIENAE